MDVDDIMTSSPVITVTPETTIGEAARLMLEHRISGLPVTDRDGAVVGIITEGDLLHRAEIGTARRHSRWLDLLVGSGRLARDYTEAHARQVGEVMSEDVVSVTSQHPLTDVVRLMETRHIKRVPVVEGGRLVGIVSRADLVRALIRSLPQSAAQENTGDQEIRGRILTQIAKQPWRPRASVDVQVKDGVAELYGSITDERERMALRVVAENIPGVKEVRDRLVWVDPISGLVIPAAGSTPPADDL